MLLVSFLSSLSVLAKFAFLSMGKSKRIKKCPGCHLPETEHSFGPRSKSCEGPPDAECSPKLSHGLSVPVCEADLNESCRLQEELLELEVEEKRLKETLALDDLRRKVEQKRVAVEELRSSSRSSNVTGEKNASSDDEDLFVPQKLAKTAPHRKKSTLNVPSINKLRQDDALVRKVDRELRKFTLEKDSDSDTDSSSESSTEESDKARKSGKKSSKSKHKGNLKSGRSSKPTSRVVNPQLWPHSELNTSFVSKLITYDDLKLDEFVAGYATILQTLNKSSIEYKARLEHLISLMYLCSRYKWEAVLNYHGAVLLDIERGRINWGDSFSYLEPRSLHGQLKESFSPNERSCTSSNSVKSTPNSIFFCGDFNKSTCRHQKDHFGSIGKGTELKWLRHICSACWLRSRAVRSHVENSSSCPLAAANLTPKSAPQA